MSKRVRISPLFVLPVAVLWYFVGGIWTICYLGALLCHELSHIYMARMLGMDSATLCLNGYGCKGEIQELDWCDAGRELPIALAGPLFNLSVAVVSAMLSQVLYYWYYPLMDFALCNLFLGGFNLLPFMPLDGGRVLRGIVCLGMSREKGTKICTRLSFIAGAVMIAVFAYYGYFGQYKIFLLIISAVIISGSLEERKKVSKYRLKVMTNENKLSSPKRVKRYAVSCEEDLKSALSYFREDCFNIVDLVTKDGKVQKTMTETELMRELLK